MDAITPGFRTDIQQRVANAGCTSEKNPVGFGEAQAERVDKNVAVVTGIEINVAADCRHTHAVAVIGDASYDAVQQVAGFFVFGIAEAQRIE